jgi:hypothetical protein
MRLKGKAASTARAMWEVGRVTLVKYNRAAAYISIADIIKKLEFEENNYYGRHFR